MKYLPVFNMKGGVAKTTTSVMLAEAAAELLSYRVLIIDCDPQLNATRMLCPDEQIMTTISQANSPRTIARYLQNTLQGTVPDPLNFITERVGTIHGNGSVDLVMGTPRTFDADRAMLSAAAQPGQTLDRILSIAEASFRSLGESYHLVIIDCPPSLTAPVEASLGVAHEVLVPTTLDDTAGDGLNTLDFRLKRLTRVNADMANRTRILLTRVRATQNSFRQKLSDRPNVLSSEISEHVKIAAARLYNKELGSNLSSKYNRSIKNKLKLLLSELGLQ